MSRLEKIQKGMNVLQILTKIAMILAYVGTALTSVAAALVAAGVLNEQNRFLTFLSVEAGTSAKQLTGILLAAAVTMLFGSILTTFVYRYFTAELKEGTPFSDAGAERIKWIGIVSIIISLVSSLVMDGIYEGFHLIEEWNHYDDAGSLTAGIFLILLSAVVRYGAELERRRKE